VEVNNTAELIDIKNKLFKVEKDIENLLSKLPNKQQVDAGRCNDYGTRGFALTIYFDELNIEVFNEENIKKMQTLYQLYWHLRKKQKAAEEKYDSSKVVEQQLADDLKKLR